MVRIPPPRLYFRWRAAAYVPLARKTTWLDGFFVMATVAELLAHKGAEVIRAPETATVFECISEMVKHGAGSIIIVDPEDNMAGVFTERDYLRRIALEGRSSRQTPVTEVMTRDVVWVDPHYTVDECMAVMTKQKIRHLPVMDNGHLLGVISIGDCVRHHSEEAEARVQFLSDYIAGQY